MITVPGLRRPPCLSPLGYCGIRWTRYDTRGHPDTGDTRIPLAVGCKEPMIRLRKTRNTATKRLNAYSPCRIALCCGMYYCCGADTRIMRHAQQI
jgi:hypothetical protein